MKKYITFSLMISIYPIYCMEPEGPSHKKMRIENSSYFNSRNLEQLKNDGKFIHAPCILLLDIDNVESEQKSATTFMLRAAVETQYCLIVTSKSLIQNLLKQQPLIDLGPSSWRLFFVPNSQLAVLLSKTFTDLYQEQGLKLNQLDEKTVLLDDIQQLSQNTANEKTKNRYDISQQLKTVFEQYSYSDITTKNNNLPVWDFVINGHGGEERIATLPISQARQLLAFFNNHIPVGAVLLQSCRANGKNKTLLQFQDDITLKGEWSLALLNYFLFVAGYPESSTLGDLTYNSNLLNTFFTNAAQLGYEKSLTNILDALAHLNTYFDIQMAINVPQVWIPGGLGFQTFSLNSSIITLGPVQVKAHELENRPFNITNKTRALLVSVPTIHVPIMVRSFAEPIKQAILPGLSFAEIQLLKIINSKIRYPRFVSMLHGNSIQYFDALTLDNTDKEAGVIRFIAQSLITFHKAHKQFLIESLKGANDLGEIIANMEPSEHHPLQDIIESNIQLKYVHIATNFLGDKKEFTISFLLNNQAWTFESSTYENYFWNFQKIDTARYMQTYNQLK